MRINHNNKPSSFRAVSSLSLLLLCVSLPQPVESFNAIINSNPVTIWLYNYFRANGCLGLPFCDNLIAAENINATNTSILALGDATLSGLYSNNNGSNGAVELGDGSLSDIFQGMIQAEEEEEEEDVEKVALGDGGPPIIEDEDEDRNIPDVVQYPEYDGPEIVLYPEVSEEVSSPTTSTTSSVVHTGIDIIEGFLGRVPILGGGNRRLQQQPQHYDKKWQQHRKNLRSKTLH